MTRSFNLIHPSVFGRSVALRCLQLLGAPRVRGRRSSQLHPCNPHNLPLWQKLTSQEADHLPLRGSSSVPAAATSSSVSPTVFCCCCHNIISSACWPETPRDEVCDVLQRRVPVPIRSCSPSPDPVLRLRARLGTPTSWLMLDVLACVSPTTSVSGPPVIHSGRAQRVYAHSEPAPDALYGSRDLLVKS